MAIVVMDVPRPLLPTTGWDMWSLLGTVEASDETQSEGPGHPVRTFLEAYGVQKVYLNASISVGPDEAVHTMSVSPRNVGLCFAGCLVVVPWESAHRVAYLRPTQLPRTDVLLLQESGGKRMVVYDLCREYQYFRKG